MRAEKLGSAKVSPQPMKRSRLKEAKLRWIKSRKLLPRVD